MVFFYVLCLSETTIDAIVLCRPSSTINIHLQKLEAWGFGREESRRRSLMRQGCMLARGLNSYMYCELVSRSVDGEKSFVGTELQGVKTGLT